MTGSEIIAFANQLLGNEELDESMALSMINVIKDTIEDKRPWQVLKKLDTTVTVTGASTYTTPLDQPEDFRRYLNEGTIQLFDGNNNIQYYDEFPYEQLLNYKDASNWFCADYGSYQFYLTGVVPGTFSVWQWYIRVTPEITLTTEWERFPSRYHKILSYELALMWRLGTDWDDVNARNGQKNAIDADNIYKAMESWDENLALSQVRNIDYPQNKQGRNINDRFWGPRGTLRN